MKNTIAFSALAMFLSLNVNAQKYFTRSGSIHFFSKTKIEDISADNNKVNVVLDAATGQVELSCLVKAFEFEKALMQEHFNENYMESDKFPKASFKGKIDNITSINFKKDGTYSAKVVGDLTMHGVTKSLSLDASFVVAGGMTKATTKFVVNPKDYNITIPDLVKDQISEKIEVTVKTGLEELKK